MLKADTRRVVRIGHRGAAGHAPENTLAAIRAGIELGADFVEVDVQRTADGRLVVLHDERVNRTTNGKGLVSAMSWDEVRALGIGIGIGGGERIPSVEEALAAADGHAGMMLEIKAAGIGGELYRAVAASGFGAPVVYASYLLEEIREIRRLDSRARTLALMERVPRSARKGAAEATIIGTNYYFATVRTLAALHDAGLEVWLFTVNKPRQIARAIAMGADGVISDFPERVPKGSGR